MLSSQLQVIKRFNKKKNRSTQQFLLRVKKNMDLFYTMGGGILMIILTLVFNLYQVIHHGVFLLTKSGEEQSPTRSTSKLLPVVRTIVYNVDNLAVSTAFEIIDPKGLHRL